MSASNPTNTEKQDAAAVREAVAQYYGEELSQSSDLKTSACATSAAPSAGLRALVDKLHEETRARYFGCGLIAPEALEGARVVDLGCGAGRDVYVLSQLVGESGHVVGVDMTEAQLDVAERWRDWHRAKFGYAKSNVSFHRGFLEDLGAVGLEPNSFDVVVSNCVINLATDKLATLKGVCELLKPGGEFYFADVYADKPLPEAAQNDSVIYGECLGGALVWSDFLSLAEDAGFSAPQLVAAALIEHYSPAIREAVGDVRFVSATARLFAAPERSDPCPSHSVRYRGGVSSVDAKLGEADIFTFDHAVAFEQDRVIDLDAESAALLKSSRFASYFDFHAARGAGAVAPRAAPDPFALANRSGARASSGCC